MPVDVQALPLVLCGPMLRRVEARSVSVFVALKAAAEVQIVVSDDTSPPTGAAVAPPHRVSARQPTVRLGRHLHVAVATLTIPNGSPALAPGHVYGYDVLLHDAPAAGQVTRLADTALLGGSHPLGFVPGRLPGFALMPDQPEAIRLLHGSCRKPHGEGDDMLAAVDDLLAPPDMRGNAAERPHLLLLTGDQIYADDVAPGLLRLLHDTAAALLDWEETFPGTGAPLEPLFELLATVRAEAEPLIGISVAAAQVEIVALRNHLAAAIDDARLAEDPELDAALRIALQAQLRRFATAAEELVGVAGDELAAGVTALAEGIVGWVQEHEPIFGDLSSSHPWGQIIGFEREADPQAAAAVEAAIDAVANADPLAPTVDALLGELAAAVVEQADEERVLGRALHDLLTVFRDRVAALGGGNGPTTTDVVGLAQEFRSELAQLRTRPYQASRISPPQRAKELRQFAQLTSDAMDSHLMFLGEFYAMYLLSFSPAAWPTPTPADSPGAPANSSRLPRPEVAVPNYGLTGALSKRGIAKSSEAVEAFAAELPKVRRVLANVPTLMIFDDHEVTDDWNLHADWVARVNASTMGPQVLRNALAAYAVFQDWGNRSGDYAPGGPGRRLLDQLAPVAVADGTLLAPATIAAPADTDQLLGVGGIVGEALPALTLAAVPDAAAVSRDPDGNYAFVAEGAPGERKRWDWDYRPGPNAQVQVIALDTRTHRGYPTAQWRLRVEVSPTGQTSVDGRAAAAILIHPEDVTRQLVDRLSQSALNIVVSPAPVFGLPLVEDLFQRLQAMSSGPEVADFEAWQSNPHGFDDLLLALREADVLLLSGDVHYAYSNVIQFPEPNPNLQRNLCVQLTSSSLRNETGLTRLLGTIGREARLLELLTLDDVSLARMQFFADQVLDAASGIVESVADAGRDLMDLPTWYEETAPMLAVWDPETWVSYWLALKDNMLLRLHLPTPQGMLAIGGGVVAFVLGELLSVQANLGTRDGEVDRGDFAMRFQADVRAPLARRQRAAQLNPPGQDIPATPVHDLKLRQADEVVGYNNVGRVEVPTGGGADVRHELIWKVHGPDGKPEALLASTIHGDATEWPRFGERVAMEALREREVWHPSQGEIHEYDEEGHELLRGYLAELEPLNTFLHVERRFYDPVSTASGEMLSWSAHFICLCLLRAGAGVAFPYSARHIDYIRAAKENRESGSDAPFHLYAKHEDEAVVRVGDIVAAAGGLQYDQIDTAVTQFVSSHCDIVVGVTDDEAICIGGNVEGDVPLRPGHTGATGWTCNRRAQPRPLQDGRLTSAGLVGVIRRRDAVA